MMIPAIFILDMIVTISCKRTILIMATFVKNFINNIKDKLVKIREFNFVIIFDNFSLKNDNFGLKIKLLKFLGIHPTYVM